LPGFELTIEPLDERERPQPVWLRGVSSFGARSRAAEVLAGAGRVRVRRIWGACRYGRGPLGVGGRRAVLGGAFQQPWLVIDPQTGEYRGATIAEAAAATSED
jgi:hypothetical protein